MQEKEDVISRQTAIDLVRDVCDAIMSGCSSHYDEETGDEVFDDILEVDAILKCNKEVRIALKHMPSAQPEMHWIPCSETVDIPDHEILACDKYGEEMFGYLAYEDEQWLCESEGCMMYDPIAWSEKPEPWRGEK